MNRRKIIKNVLLEVAGISFEVREWAKIIGDYVNDYVEKERKKNKPAQQKHPKKPQFNTYLDFTHFEDLSGKNKYYEAFVYGEDLSPMLANVDVMVYFDEMGIDIECEPMTINPRIVESLVFAYMRKGGTFFLEDDTEVFASKSEEEGQGYYDFASLFDRFNRYDTYTPPPKIDFIEINGKDFPSAYENFKVDKWVMTNSTRIEYDHWKSGYDDDGQYVVYLNMPIPSSGSALIHEIKHAYDDWNRMSRGGKPIRDSWEIKNIYTPDFEKLILGGSYKLNQQLHPVIRYYYLGSKLEQPAYLENEYDMASQYRDVAIKMSKFKASNFLDKRGNPAKGLQESWEELITNYDIPFFKKFPDVVDFLLYTEKYFNKRGREILKRIDKMRYVHGKIK